MQRVLAVVSVLGQDQKGAVARFATSLADHGANIEDRDGGDDGVVRLEPGETIAIGSTQLVVAIEVQGTVEIRNGFGNLSRSTEAVTLRVPTRATQTAALLEAVR